MEKTFFRAPDCWWHERDIGADDDVVDDAGDGGGGGPNITFLPWRLI